MRTVMLALVALAVITTASPAQTSHPPIYLIGVGNSLVQPQQKGIWVYDGTGVVPTLTRFTSEPGYGFRPNTVIMDWNNQGVLAATVNPYTPSTISNPGRILRWSPKSSSWAVLATFYRRPGSTSTGYGYEYVYSNMLMDQNGDVVFSTWKYDRVTSPTTVYGHERCVMKLDRTTNVVTTVLTTTQVPAMDSDTFGSVLTDIDTGKLLITCNQYETSAKTIKYPVLTLSPEDGYNPASLGYWNDGPKYGWANYSSTTRQNHRTGKIETPHWDVNPWSGGKILALGPGSASLTTLASFPIWRYPAGPGDVFYQSSGKYDLQTAPDPIYRANSHVLSGRVGGWLCNYDVLNGWKMLPHTTLMSPTFTPQLKGFFGSSNFDFCRGRHIQTVRTGSNKWDIRVSVPHHPGKGYALVGGVSGVRPGIALPDGRNINLNWDGIFFMTLINQLRPFFDSGPLKLDANGEAKGVLDLSTLPIPKNGLGMPFWMAMAVLDQNAPCGVAYLPDTYVMRL